ncbi:MAG: nuclear transport factor 2 family protein [Maribacter sp.]
MKIMKNLLLLGLAIVLFTACKEQGPERWTNMSPEIDVTKALVKDYEDGNWESWSSHYADAAEVHHNSVESITQQQLQDGLKADIMNYSSYGFSHADDEIFFEQIIDDKGDKWVYFWGTWEAVMKGNNEKYQIPVHIALKFVDNKIVEEHGFYNRSAIDAAIKQIADMKAAEEQEM